MKRTLQTVILLFLCQWAFAQTAMSHRLTRATVSKSAAHAFSQSRAPHGGSRANRNVTLNYAFAEDSLATLGGNTPTYYRWDVNMRFPVDSFHNYDLRWAYQAVDSLVDYPSLQSVAFPTSSYTLDSLVVPLHHVNVSGLNDTIIIVEYARTVGSTPTTNVNGTISNTILHADTFITNTSFSATGFNGALVTPNLTIAGGQHFGVAVYFYGSTLDTFGLLANYEDKCAAACVAAPSIYNEQAFFNLILFTPTNTSLSGAQGNINSLVYYDCNGNTTKDASDCEFFYIQNFDADIYLTIPSAAAAPVADFTANQTNIAVGGSVNFTDLSTNSPTSWSWSFPGGSPATSTAQNPSNIVYNTAGTYNVTLTATNATGSNAKTKTGYIVVTQGGNSYILCDTLANFLPTDSPKVYTTTGGYLSGQNGFGDLGKADYFVNPNPGAPINTAFILFGVAKSNTPSHTFNVVIWNNNGAGGAPGTALATIPVTYASAIASLSTGFLAVPLPTNPAPAGNFYIGITFTYAAGDTLALITDKTNQHATNTGWEKQSSGTWYAMSDPTNAWGANFTHYIAYAQCATITCPTITGTVTHVNATCTASNGTITAAGAGGTAPYTYKWGTSPIQTTATATGVAAGTYTVTITDTHGCTGTSSGTVGTTNSTIAPNITTNPAVCTSLNGSATAAPSGGTAPYTYHWSTNATTASINNVAAATYGVTITDANGCSTVGSAVVPASSGTLNATVATVNAVCTASNGSATATATGGTTPYAYSWSTVPAQTSATASNLAAGTFIVTVSDANGCSVVKTATVTASNGNLQASATSTAATCGQSNGSVTVVPSGGTAGYTYHWNGGQSTATVGSLGAGTYNVTVTDANGCVANASATVSSPSSPVPSLNVVNVACFGGNNGSASVTVAGGVAPFTYSWSPSGSGTSISSLSAGPVGVTVTDNNGCTGSASGTVTQPASALSVSIPTTTNPACAGASSGSATALASGGTSGYTFNWSTVPAQTNATATGLAAGSYTVTVTDAHGCSTTANTNITNPVNGVSVTVANGTTSACGVADGSLHATATNGATPYSYSWSTSPVQTGATATNLAGGTYHVTVTDAGGCTATAVATVVEPGAQTATATATPTNCFGGHDGGVTVSVTGGSGNFTYTWTSAVSTTNAATGLAAGTYSITVHDGTSNCNAFTSGTVNQPSQVTIAVNTVDVTCFGGTNGIASATVSGGTPNYTYQWLTSPIQTTNAVSGLAAGSYILNVLDAHSCTASQTVVINQPTQIVGTISKTDVTCNGANNGVALASASGGNGPYNFAWSTTPAQNGATAGNLAPGSYTVTITDSHSCTATQSTSITEPTALTASVSAHTNVSCNAGNNGTATVSATGGTGAYSYNWSTSPAQSSLTATGLAAGTYSVTVKDANNCTVTTSTTITEPTALSVAVNATNVACNGASNGSATAAVTGGTTTYSYSWSTSPVQTTATATGLGVGTVSVTVTDANSCTATGSNVLTQPTVITAVPTVANAGCAGDSTGHINLAVTGGTPTYTYGWSNGSSAQNLTGVPSGTYSVTITDNSSCTTTLTGLTVNDGATLAITASGTPETAAGVGGTVTANVTGGAGTIAYHWSNGGNGSSLANLAHGTYIVTATDANGCVVIDSATVGIFIGIADVANAATLGLFPNPTSGNVTIDLKLTQAADVTVEWFSMIGEKIVTEQFMNTSSINRVYDLSAHAAGVYFAKITYNGQSLTRKVIVNH